MHILTKILVVFAAGLSLALAALTSTYALNAKTITESYNAKVDEAKEANANYELQSSQFADERANLQDDINASRSALADLDQQRLSLLSQLEELRIQAKQAEDARARVERQIGDLGKTADTQAVLITSLTDEVRTLRDENLTGKTQRIDLLARLNDLENQNDVLTQTNRALQEVVAGFQNEASTGNAARDADAGVGGLRELDGPPVRGRVRAVRSSDGQQFAEIDLGTRDRVRENVKLFITRDGRWVADLNIVRADIQTAVGRVDALGRTNVQVREGDFVLSTLDR
ncbi:MAG: hypothetical protein AAFN41_08370 [Planctomycetota bacterium]